MEKISQLAGTISGELSNICDCYVPTDYIGDRRIICSEDNPNKVIFQGRLISTHKRNATQLMEGLTQWVTTAPLVVVQGVQLVTEMDCSVELSELGDSKCVMTQEKKQMEVTQADEVSILPIVLGITVTVVLLALILLTACSILVLRKKVM